MSVEKIAVIGIIVVALLCYPGCSTVKTVAQNVASDGSNRTVSQSWTTPPFGTMGAGAGTISATQGADGVYSVSTGQNVSNVDNTAQAAVATAFMSMLTTGLSSYLGSALAQPTPANGQPNMIQQLLNAWIAAHGGTVAPTPTPTPKMLEAPIEEKAPVVPVKPVKPVVVPIPKG